MKNDQIASFVKQARQNLGYTQAEMAKFAEVTKASVSGWENGLYEPDFATLFAISQVSGVPLPNTGASISASVAKIRQIAHEAIGSGDVETMSEALLDILKETWKGEA